MANVLAKMAKRIHWYPHKIARLANNSVWASKVLCPMLRPGRARR